MAGRSSAAKRYHTETKYSEEKLAQDRHELDWSAQPQPYKTYASDERIYLGRYLPIQPNIFTPKEALYEDVPGHDWDSLLGKLSRTLYLSNGVTAYVQTMADKHALRAAPSAGALYPTEMYVALRDFGNVKEGIYNYQVSTHSLVLHWEGDFWAELEKASYGHEAIRHSQIVVIYSGIWFRSSWRYQERGYRRVLLDTGHVLGNMAAYAGQEELGCYAIGGFYDDLLNSLLFFNEEEEGVLLLAALPRQEQVRRRKIRKVSVYPDGAKPAPGTSAVELHIGSKSGADVIPGPAALPDMDGLHDIFKSTPSIALPGAGEKDLPKAPQETILRRRSTRAFSGGPMNKEQLGAVLGYAYEPVHEMMRNPKASMTAAGLFDASLLSTYVVAQSVKDVDEGVYGYDPLEHSLRLIRKGEMRGKIWHCCLGQELGRDAGAVVVHTCDLDTAVQRYGERAYRYAHLDAGHLGQRINLAAVGNEIGVSGIGGFFDDEMNDLLGLPLNNIIVYITTLGMPQ